MSRIQYFAVKAIVTDKSGKEVLVLQQSHEQAVDGHGQYHPPGGIIELGEKMNAALVREVKEETGITVTVNELVGLEERTANIRGDECFFIFAFFHCTLQSGKVSAADKHEVAGYKWIGPEDLGNVDILQPSKKVIEEFFASQKAK